MTFVQPISSKLFLRHTVYNTVAVVNCFYWRWNRFSQFFLVY